MAKVWAVWGVLFGVLWVWCDEPVAWAYDKQTTSKAVRARHQHLPELNKQLASLTQPVVVILFSAPDCTYCEQVRAHTLRHVERDSRYLGKVRVFEVDQAAHQSNTLWFDGRMHSGKDLTARLGVKFAPTVIVFRRSTGEAVGAPLLGAGLPDFYGAYLNDLIELAMK